MYSRFCPFHLEECDCPLACPYDDFPHDTDGNRVLDSDSYDIKEEECQH